MLDLPNPRFFLFGMGQRPKLLYRSGTLYDALSGQVVHRFAIRSERIVPAEYRVEWVGADGTPGAICEDERGIWLEHRFQRTPLGTCARVRLPRFENFPHAPLLRVLHHEILVNVLPAGPVPNLFVYRRPWYRDAASMAMCLKLTHNIGLLADWIASIADPFDRRSGVEEPDNLGQVLYLASLIGGREHPVVQDVLAAAARIAQDRHLVGLTDGAPHPVYQTKWLKFGLRALKLDDGYEIPAEHDSYSALFWMDYRDAHVPAPRIREPNRSLYPYLAWAQSHFYGEPPPMDLSGTGYPMTWESKASQADYEAARWVDQAFSEQKVCLPHAWHAAEMMLYLMDAT